MRAVEDDDDRRGELVDAQERIESLRARIDEANIQLIWDEAVRELHQHSAWRRLGERITNYRVMAVEQMASRRMDLYELGQVQGRLSMLRVLTQLQPLSADTLDGIKRYLNDLEAQLAEATTLR